MGTGEQSFRLDEYLPFHNGILRTSDFAFFNHHPCHMVTASMVIDASFDPALATKRMSEEFKRYIARLCDGDVD
jgi:hypothetical protein